MRTSVGDSSVGCIVIVGNGIAGITARERVHLLHPTCAVRIVESDALPVAIDTDNRQILLATGERVAYDRLILTSSHSNLAPAIDGFGTSGSFVVSEADDLAGVENHIRCHHAHKAIVAGAGLLGLEAAYRLRKMDLAVSVLADAEHVINSQLDFRSSRLVQHRLDKQGIKILTDTEAVSLGHDNQGRVNSIYLKDGRVLPTDIVVAGPRISPSVELAKTAGLATRRGILVDDYMQASQPEIYAAGEVAEHNGITRCHPSFAAEQGEVAACNALGDKRHYHGRIPEISLRLTGIDLLSIGQIDANSNGVYSIVDEQAESFRYRKLIFTAGQLLGAILIGYPDDAGLVTRLVKRGADLSPVISALHRGRWNELARLEAAA